MIYFASIVPKWSSIFSIFFVGGQLHSQMLCICKTRLINLLPDFIGSKDLTLILSFKIYTIIYSISFMISLIMSKISICLKFNLVKDGTTGYPVISTLLIK